MLALMQEISPKGFQSDSQIFRFSLPRGADGQDLHDVFVYMKKRGTVEKLPQNQIVWTEPQAPTACLLYKLDCVCNYREKGTSVVTWPYSMGKMYFLDVQFLG